SLRISRLTSYGCFGVKKGENIKAQVSTRGDLAMANPTDIESAGDGAKDGAKRVSRRAFIKGVIGSGIAASSANYLFRTSTLLQGQPPAVGGERLITLNVNGQQRRVDVMKQETLAWT